MKNTVSPVAALAMVASMLGGALPAAAQVAGGSTGIDATISETTQIALGWSVKKALLHKLVYNDVGEKVGRVEDLIIAPDRSVSYVIVGAGGFVGIGRHDVAIPVTQIQEKAGRLVMSGATKDTIRNLPEFVYATPAAQRDAFFAGADRDIARGRAAVATLEKKASAAASDDKARINGDLGAVQADLKAAESRVADMKQAGAARWREFEADVSAATARLRKSIEKATG